MIRNYKNSQASSDRKKRSPAKRQTCSDRHLSRWGEIIQEIDAASVRARRKGSNRNLKLLNRSRDSSNSKDSNGRDSQGHLEVEDETFKVIIKNPFVLFNLTLNTLFPVEIQEIIHRATCLVTSSIHWVKKEQTQAFADQKTTICGL